MFKMNFFVCFLLIFFVANTVALACTVTNGTSLLPIGCNVITTGLNLSGVSQNDLLKYSNITVVTQKSINITNNPNLTSLEGFNALTRASLRISDNINLKSLKGLDSLASCYVLTIERNPSLISLEGLISLTTSGTFTIYNSLGLVSLKGLGTLTSVGHLKLIENHNLRSLKGLDSFTSADWSVVVEKNEKLTSLEGLNSLNISSVVSVHGNPSLTSLNGLNSLTTLRTNLQVYNNSALTSYYGLGSVNSISSSLRLGWRWDGKFPNKLLDCNNVCNQKLIYRLRSVTAGTRPYDIRDQCDITSFNCSGNPSTISDQKLNCSYGSVCTLCDESTCDFTGTFTPKLCGDVIIQNEECNKPSSSIVDTCSKNEECFVTQNDELKWIFNFNEDETILNDIYLNEKFSIKVSGNFSAKNLTLETGLNFFEPRIDVEGTGLQVYLNSEFPEGETEVVIVSADCIIGDPNVTARSYDISSEPCVRTKSSAVKSKLFSVVVEYKKTPCVSYGRNLRTYLPYLVFLSLVCYKGTYTN